MSALVDVFGVAYVAMGGERHRPDHDCRRTVCDQQGSDAFRRLQIPFSIIGHGSLAFRSRIEPGKAITHRKRRFDPLLDAQLSDPFEFGPQRRIGACAPAAAGKLRFGLRHKRSMDLVSEFRKIRSQGAADKPKFRNENHGLHGRHGLREVYGGASTNSAGYSRNLFNSLIIREIRVIRGTYFSFSDKEGGSGFGKEAMTHQSVNAAFRAFGWGPPATRFFQEDALTGCGAWK
jgi:hypothetical protein